MLALGWINLHGIKPEKQNEHINPRNKQERAGVQKETRNKAILQTLK